MYIHVQLRKDSENQYGPRLYTYQTDLAVEKGDIVIAPTISGLRYGRVAETHIPYESLDPAWRDKLREIVDYAPQPTETPGEIDELFDEGRKNA